MRDKAHRAVYEAKYLEQQRERFKPASEFIEAIPTLTDSIAPESPEGVGADTPESEILQDVLAACTYHPRVAWCRRINSGVMKAGKRYVRFGFKGCSDIIGQLRDGRFFACETKKVGEQPTQDQIEFLGLVHRNHGLAFVARSAADARNALNEYGDAA